MSPDHKWDAAAAAAEDAAHEKSVLAEFDHQVAILRAAYSIDDLPKVIEVARAALDPADDDRYQEILFALSRIARFAQSTRACASAKS